jgi:MFS family permease
MAVLVTGRLVQGFGGGALTVALYVAVARWYPARLHPMVFVGFSTSWVLPSLIGPFVAGS